MNHVHLQHINSVYIRVVTDPGTLREISDNFTFFAHNYRFHPKFRMKVWDGKIRLVNAVTGHVYAGLAQRIKKFCEERDYDFTFDEELTYDNVSLNELQDFIRGLNLPEDKTEREYQVQSVLKCLRSRRRTLESPTSSGKSLMIYMISQWYKKKTLIIVPTIGLVNQMASDFVSYGYEGVIHKSTDGLDRSNDIPADIVITTWQSLDNGKTKMLKPWYQQFEVVFGDEAHGCKAATLVSILAKLENCKYRFGTTGTLDGDPLNETTIEGLFGPKFKSITTKELMEQGYVADLKIKCIVLKYPDEVAKQVKGMSYQDEVNFLTNNEERNNFIKNLTLSLKGNKLVFFRLNDHGEKLYQLIKESGYNAFYIDGTIKSEVREDIRHAIEDEENATLVASLGTTSTGISINKLHHMIAAHPSKSKIKVLQSIGRMLRMHKEKNEAVLYDIVDDLSYKSHKNYTLKHFVERVKIYDAEKFDYKFYNVKLRS
jgi:superfamily II DNA or RNA helicase